MVYFPFRIPSMNEKEWFDFHKSVLQIQEKLFQNITPAQALEVEFSFIYIVFLHSQSHYFTTVIVLMTFNF